jgi:hypothetical protein
MSSARGGISAFQISGWVQAHPYCYTTGQRESAGAKAQIFVGPNGPTKSRALIQSIRAMTPGKLAHSADLDLFVRSEMYKLQTRN